MRIGAPPGSTLLGGQDNHVDVRWFSGDRGLTSDQLAFEQYDYRHRLGIYGRWMKIRFFFETFPYYRKSSFVRQKSYLKTERMR